MTSGQDDDRLIAARAPHVLYYVRVIFERRALDNPWLSHKWVVNDLIPIEVREGNGAVPMGSVALQALRCDDARAEQPELYMADIMIDLHRAEAEAYAENLQSSDPALYIVLRADDEGDDENGAQDSDAGLSLVAVSLSPYAVQDYEDCGEDQVEKLPLQGPIAEFVADFVEAHFRPESFVKRRRGAARIDADENRGGDKRVRGAGVFATPDPKGRLH